MRVVVTGSSGFVGSQLVNKLKGSGDDIIEIDKVNGIDITQWEDLRSIQDFDIIYHLAARIFVPDSYEKPRDFYFTNIVSTLNALELCRRNNAKLIYISSYVYGKPEYLPIDEKHPIRALNPYSESKISCERLCEAYHRDFGLNTIIIRPFNLYGPNQDKSFLIPKIIAQAKKGRIKLKSASPKRDFLFIDDFIEVLLLLKDLDILSSDIFNVGYGKSYSVEEIVKIVGSIIGGIKEVIYEDEDRPNEIENTIADISKIQKVIKWYPKTSFHEGLKKIITLFTNCGKIYN